MATTYRENANDTAESSENGLQRAALERVGRANQLLAELSAPLDTPQPLLDHYTQDNNSLLKLLQYMAFKLPVERSPKPKEEPNYLNDDQRGRILTAAYQVVFNQYPKLDEDPQVRLDTNILQEYVKMREVYTPGADHLDWMLVNLHCITTKFFQVSAFKEYETTVPFVRIEVDEQGNDVGNNIARIAAKALERPADGDHQKLLISLYNATGAGSRERERLLTEVSTHVQQARESGKYAQLNEYEKLLDWLYMRVSLKQTNPPSLLNNELYDSLHKALRREYVHAICHPQADLTGMLPLLLSAGLEEYYRGYAERREENGIELPPPLVKISIIDSTHFQKKLDFHLSAVGNLQHLDELIWNHNLENLATAILAIKLRSCREELRGEVADQKLIIKNNPLLGKIFGV